jgi:hypothetical protein
MKYNSMNITNSIFKTLAAFAIILSFVFFAGCDVDDPQKEDVPELITKVTLTFTPDGGGDDIMVTATDPDGTGLQPIEVDGAIELNKATTYTLDIELINELADVNDPAYDITDEVREEGDEHMFFFSWTNDVFSDPAGNGNIDTRADGVNYEDEDVNSLPIGLTTSWTTAVAVSSGTFHILLKHQPGLKTGTSSASAGETDIDIPFVINIE